MRFANVTGCRAFAQSSYWGRRYILKSFGDLSLNGATFDVPKVKASLVFVHLPTLGEVTLFRGGDFV